MRTRWIGVVMLMALLIGACSMPGIEADLDGTWILLRGVDDGAPITPIPEAPVTISMSDGRVGGTAACNGYQGTIDRSGTSIAIGGHTKTAIGCEPPIAALEEAYLAALPRATDAVRVGD